MFETVRLGRLLKALAVAFLTMGAATPAVRYNDLGHKMMCVCGCNQILIECNHLGCPDSERMLGELRTAVASGSNDDAILMAFQDKYGPTVLAAPMLTKFNVVAWIIPPAVLILGVFGTVLLVRRWRQRAAAAPPISIPATFSGMRERIRRETEL
ncbi:MAG: cytochrome c-type biogenesis protein CcmH [Silvibacterium sp.]|nr:cytochrome c-type biogenesis protein CcmH [Silvibacterium sp.]